MTRRQQAADGGEGGGGRGRRPLRRPFALVRGFALALAVLAAGAGRVRGADASVEFDVQPAVLQVGETATATITVRGIRNPPQAGMPALDGFQGGPVSQSQQFQFNNGVADNYVQFRYPLTATKAGDFTIGPFTYDADGRKFPLPARPVHVAAAGAPAGAPAGTGASDLAQMVFAKVELPRTTVYLQEVFDLQLALYSQGVNLDSTVNLMNMPETGLEIGQFQEVAGGREDVGGRIYEIRRFRAKARALTAGTFTLSPVLRVGIVMQERRQRRGGPFDNPFFDGFFGPQAEVRPYNAATKPVALAIRPLPTEGRPPSFSGAVGKFDWQVAVKPAELTVGEPLTVTMALSGVGNLDSVSAPAVNPGAAFRAYEPKLLSAEPGRRKVFEQVFIPRDPAVKELPAISFSYFDTEAGVYRTIARGPFPLVLHPAANGASRILQAPAAAGPVELAVQGTDIVYLKPAPVRWERAGERPWYRQRGVLAAHALPLLALGALWAVVRRRDALEKDVARARREQAPKAARAAVQRAEAHAKAGQAAECYEAVSEALQSYFGNRLNLAAGEVTAEAVHAAVERAGLAEASREALRNLFAECEAARFSGAAGGAARAGEALGTLTRLLRECERLKIVARIPEAARS